MPSSHRAHAEWTPSRLIHWAEKTGPATGRLVAGILKSRPHPEQGYRACLGLMRLGRSYGAERLEAACTRAEHLRSYSDRTVKNILVSAQDRLPFESEPAALAPTPSHENIRGAGCPWRRHLSRWRGHGGDELVSIRRSDGRKRRPRNAAVASVVPGTLPDADGDQERMRIRGRWTGPRRGRSPHQVAGRPGPYPLGEFHADIDAARTWACG